MAGEHIFQGFSLGQLAITGGLKLDKNENVPIKTLSRRPRRCEITRRSRRLRAFARWSLRRTFCCAAGAEAATLGDFFFAAGAGAVLEEASGSAGGDGAATARLRAGRPRFICLPAFLSRDWPAAVARRSPCRGAPTEPLRPVTTRVRVTRRIPPPQGNVLCERATLKRQMRLRPLPHRATGRRAERLLLQMGTPGHTEGTGYHPLPADVVRNGQQRVQLYSSMVFRSRTRDGSAWIILQGGGSSDQVRSLKKQLVHGET